VLHGMLDQSALRQLLARLELFGAHVVEVHRCNVLPPRQMT
jgi:hypothetical protein